MAITVKVSVPGLERIRRAIERNPRLRQDVAQAWETIYRAFVRQRFAASSRGGGDWPGLAPSTLKRRRGGGQGAAILRDTGAMFAALQPSLGGSGLLQSKPLQQIGFIASLGGSSTYKGGTTIADVATFHHKGGGRLPKREILVQPDSATIKKMGDVARRIISKHLHQR